LVESFVFVGGGTADVFVDLLEFWGEVGVGGVEDSGEMFEGFRLGELLVRDGGTGEHFGLLWFVQKVSFGGFFEPLG
jgi:hypothetical protein